MPPSPSGGSPSERSPLLPKTVQDIPPAAPSSSSSAPSEEEEDTIYGFNYVHNNLSNPISPKHSAEDNGEIPARIPPLPTRSTLHSFPPAFNQDQPPAPHNFWDVLCHSIEYLSSAGTLGVVGAVVVLIVFVVTCSGLIPNAPWNGGNGDGGSGLFGMVQGLEDRFATAIQQAAFANLTKLTVEGFSEGQVSIYAAADLSFNYTNVDDGTAAFFLRSSGFSLHSINVAPTTSQIYVKKVTTSDTENDSSEDDPYQLAFVAHAPGIDNLVLREFHHTNLSMNINVTAFDHPNLLTDMVRKLLMGDPIPIRLTTTITLSKWFIPLGSYPVSVDTIINPSDGDKGKFSHELDKMKLAELEFVPQAPKGGISSGLGVVARLLGDFKMPFSFHIPRINWDVAIPGCHYDEKPQDVITVTEIHNLPIDIDPLRDLELKVETVIKKLSAKISKVCQGSSHSAIDTFLQHYLAGEETKLIVQGSYDQSFELPWWMRQIIPLIKLPVPIPPRLLGNATDEKLVEEIEFTRMKIQLPPPRSPFDRPAPNPKPADQPKISGHIAVTLHPPSILNMTRDVGLGVDKVKGIADLISPDSGILFAKLNISDWVPCTTWVKAPIKDPGNGGDAEDDKEKPSGLIDYVVEFDLDAVPLTVMDQKTLSSVATKFIMKGEAELIFDAVVDLDLDTPVGAFALNKIPIHGDTVMKT